MAKDPTPRADALRAQREARYGHLQATTEPAKPKMGRPAGSHTKSKLIGYAGRDNHAIAPPEPKGTTGKQKPGRVPMKKKGNRP